MVPLVEDGTFGTVSTPEVDAPEGSVVRGSHLSQSTA